MADLVPAEKRLDAYSLLRTSNNMGVALGPAIGGILASISYTIAFVGAATGLVTFSLLVAFGAKETLPRLEQALRPPKEKLGGYLHLPRPAVHQFPGCFHPNPNVRHSGLGAIGRLHEAKLPASREPVRFDSNDKCSDGSVFPDPGHPGHQALSPPAVSGGGIAVLCGRRGQHCARPGLLGFLAEHGHPDHWRADPVAHGDYIRR